jgi:hypothetical protein
LPKIDIEHVPQEQLVLPAVGHESLEGGEDWRVIADQHGVSLAVVALNGLFEHGVSEVNANMNLFDELILIRGQ